MLGFLNSWLKVDLIIRKKNNIPIQNNDIIEITFELVMYRMSVYNAKK